MVVEDCCSLGASFFISGIRLICPATRTFVSERGFTRYST